MIDMDLSIIGTVLIDSICLIIAVWIIFEFINESKIRKQRQKSWNGIKRYFKSKDISTEELHKIYNAYISTFSEHWLLGGIFPDFGDE